MRGKTSWSIIKIFTFCFAVTVLLIAVSITIGH